MFAAMRAAAVVAALALGTTFLAVQIGDPPRVGPSSTAQDVAAGKGGENAHGSIWLQREGFGPWTYYVFHGDGLALGFDRNLGIGVGLWEPLGEHSLTADLRFAKTDPTYVQLTPDTGRLRFTGSLDEAGDLMTLVYEPNDLGLTTMTAVRQKMAPMPPEAGTATPPDTGWQPMIGIVSHDADASGITIERYGGRPNYDLGHSDGTWVSINTWVGPGVGLTAAPDEYHGLLTAWYTGDLPQTPPLVAQVTIDPETGEETNAYGTSSGFTDSAPGEPQEPLSVRGGEPLLEPDPTWWPSRGSLWIEARESGPEIITAMHADGTLLTIDPYRGIGVGSWQPTGPDTAALTIDYYDTDPALETSSRGPATLLGDVRFDPAGESATVDFVVDNELPDGAVRQDSGSSVLQRQSLDG